MMINMMETNTLSHTMKTISIHSPEEDLQLVWPGLLLQKARCPANHFTD